MWPHIDICPGIFRNLTAEMGMARPAVAEAAEIVLPMGSDWVVADILDVFAGLALDCGKPARMLGTVQALSEAAGMPLDDPAYHERLVADSQAELNDARFTEAWDAGQKMDPASAVAHALEATAERPA